MTEEVQKRELTDLEKSMRLRRVVVTVGVTIGAIVAFGLCLLLLGTMVG